MRTIYLSDRDESKFCIIDDEDYDWISQYKWSFRFDKSGKKVYAMRNTRINGQHVTLYMHVEIMKRTGIMQPSPRSHITDHKNGDSTDNRRTNLRWATVLANARNRRKR